MKKYALAATGLLAAIAAFCPAAYAKIPDNVQVAVISSFPPAQPHKGLETAYEEPQPSKMRGYVVMMKGGILAERARYFISWDDYDYRGAVINMDKQEEISTRRGAPYTYLQRGDVLAVTEVKFFSNTIYLKLQSADVYIPENRRGEKHHSRVTVMLGFEFSAKTFDSKQPEDIVAAISEWVKPFASLGEAKAYASTIRPEMPAAPVAAPAVSDKPVKESAKAPASPAAETPPAAVSPTDNAGVDEKVKSLEQKINEAKKQIEDAEKEMQKMKSK